jgi:hypothetical protein
MVFWILLTFHIFRVFWILLTFQNFRLVLIVFKGKLQELGKKGLPGIRGYWRSFILTFVDHLHLPFWVNINTLLLSLMTFLVMDISFSYMKNLRISGSKIILLVLYVDDIFLASNDLDFAA